ncbi:MAG: alkaline phosphatase [Candidatus Thorarchaeota archaeon]
MKKNIKRLLLIIILQIIVIGIRSNDFTPSNSSYQSHSFENTNIILMIGDGMGFEHLKLAQWVELGIEGQFSIESFPEKLSVITRNILGITTDSAAAATAIATGEKTTNGKIAMSTDNKELQTILEIAQKQNKSTGIITTTSIQHATPACFMAHVSSRNDYYEITKQIVEEAGVDLLMGGGRSYFTEADILEMETAGYQIVNNRTTFENISIGKVLGLYADSHLPFEEDKDYEQIPTLAEMVEKSIAILSQDEDGFFMMVEGGKIDSAAHDNQKEGVALETIAFIDAVNEALAFTKENSNTILIVTADHETGGLLVRDQTLGTILPSSGNSLEQNRTLRLSRVEQIDVTFKRTGHTDTLVPFYGFGKAFENLLTGGIIDNTYIYKIMENFTLGKELMIEEFDINSIDIHFTKTLIITVSTVFAHAIVLAIPLITTARRYKKQKKLEKF